MDDKMEMESEEVGMGSLPKSFFGKMPPKPGSTVTIKIVDMDEDDDGMVDVQIAGTGAGMEEEAAAESDIMAGIDKIPATDRM